MHSSASEPRLKLESLVSLVYTNTLAAWERGRPGLAVHQVLGRSGSTVNMESELTVHQISQASAVNPRPVQSI